MGLHPREMVVGKLGQEGILTLPKMLSLQQEGIKLDKGKLGTMALKIEGAGFRTEGTGIGSISTRSVAGSRDGRDTTGIGFGSRSGCYWGWGTNCYHL
uniref:Uncharacterized protein n=1 Tax=Picea glauca TaxID=3330 RepID=A0A117NIX4_PICGL|nr:hypothetical protein ABT39_MTgene399 [Picea glauca]QHR92190.1 hypothetical protein Q903MT_gene6227 [Picea sitchensis]